MVGYLPQGQRIELALRVRDVVALGRWPHGLTDPSRPRPADAAAIARAMAATGTTALADRPVTLLSGGERARVLIARVLATEAPVVLADEPTAALDPRYQLEVMALLRAIAAEGRVVVAVTHDLTHAARFADTVMVLQAGAAVAHGPPAATLTPAVIEAVFGVACVPVAAGGRTLALPWEPAP
jgi:iron complex transport system ATP-binding protein